MFPAHENGEKTIDEQIQEVKERSRRSFRETMILADQAPDEAVSETIPHVDTHLQRARKKSSDIRGDTRQLDAVKPDNEKEKSS